jgi:ATP-binding cassette, subfamily A (ABC1), member 3
MEEAGALSVRIGILAKHMLATGSSRQLRSRYGDAYHIHLVLNNAPHTTLGEVEHIRAFMAANLPGATEEGTAVTGQLHFVIPKGRNDSRQFSQHNDQAEYIGDMPAPQLDIDELFRFVEDKKQELGVKFYSIEETTLDQVFLRIVNQHNIEEMEEDKPRRKFWPLKS